MNAAIAKKLQLIAEWDDRGYNKGVEKGKINTEQLKKRAKELAAAFIAVGAALIALTAGLIKFIKTGAQVRSVSDSFWGFVESANMGADTLERINVIVNDTVRDMDLMQASTQALAAGLEPERLEEFWGKAKQMADVMSKDTLDVFENLVSGYTKLETETLKTIGITLRADDVYKEYANSLGKTAAALTTAERRTAFYIALHERYMKGFYSVGDVTTRNRELFQQLEKKIKDTWDRLNEMVAMSPAVQGFLEMLIEKADQLGVTLEEKGDDISRFTEDLIKMTGALLKLGGFVIDHGDEILAFMAALAASKVISWAVGFANALGLIGTSAAAAGGWAGLIVGAVILIANNYKTVVSGFLELWDIFNRFFWSLLDLFLYGVEMAMRAADKIPGIDLSGLIGDVAESRASIQEQIFGKTFIDGLQDKVAEWPEFNIFSLLFPKDKQKPPEVKPDEAGRTPGGLSGILPEPEEDWESRHQMQVNSYINAELQKAEEHIDIMTELGDTLDEIDATRSALYWERMDAETEHLRRHQGMRIQAYQRGFQAMGFYATEFFRKGAHMGRALNAALIAGFSEMVASYIEAKSAQAKIDAMEYSYQAIAAAARGDWGMASAFAVAAARAGVQAGAAIVSAGYVRAWGQEKAAGLERQEDAFDRYESEQGEGTRTRTKAAGVVQQRPVHLTVVATTNIEAGLIVFPDGSEEAAEQFYQDYTRDQIQADIEAGVIALPA